MSDILKAFEEYLLVTKALESKSVYSYVSDLVQFESSTKKELLKVDTQDILNFLSQFSNSRTLNRKLSSINAFFSFCYKNSFSDHKVKIPMAKVPKNLPKYLDSKDIMKAIENIDRSNLIGLRDYAFILFLYASGCRVSEALSVQRSDIVDGWVTIRFAKGSKQRVVPLAPIAVDALNEYLKYSDISSLDIWLNYKGDRLSRISAYKIVMKYLGVSPHVLRHSFASALIIGGADLRVVQELLGHSSLDTTQIYTHIQKKNLQNTIESYHPLKGAS